MPNGTFGAMHQAIEGTALPLTPAGRQLAAFLRAFNSGTPNANRDFIAEHCAAAALKQQSVMERADLVRGGGLSRSSDDQDRSLI
jgi:hypothetical protein